MTRPRHGPEPRDPTLRAEPRDVTLRAEPRDVTLRAEPRDVTLRGSHKTAPLFLARQTYRRRRWMDAARFLPFLALVLFVMPAIWAPQQQTGGTRDAMVYLFAVWAGLILMAGLLARYLTAPIGTSKSGAQDEDRTDGL